MSKQAAKNCLKDLENISQVYPETLKPIHDYIAELENKSADKKPAKKTAKK